MRRFLAVVLLAAVAALLHVVAPPQATAGAVIDGQVVQYGGDPVPGTTVRLHIDDGGAPGAVVDTETTNATGEFTLSPATDGLYWVEVVRNNQVQGGYVADFPSGPSWVEPGPSDPAAPVANGTHLGRVLALPSFVQGFVVNAATGARVRGIRVSTRDSSARDVVLNADTTDTDGVFRIPVFQDGDSLGLYFKGAARGYENGWRACNATVVPHWGAACASPLGHIGKVKLDHL
jgi:hypothetical protein